MVFENDKVRIGPTGAQKELFKMPGKGGTLRNGKRFEIPQYFNQLGLNAYEFPGGRMSKFNDSPEYEKFRMNAEKFDVAVSLHAPYYISLTSENPETYERSIERIAHSYAWASYLNAKRIVLHPGSYGGQKPSSSSLDSFMTKKKSNPSNSRISQIVDGIKQGIDQSQILYPTLASKFKEICLCPETMGKQGQLGTIPEVIEICKSVGLEKTRPCIDFGHLYARNLGKIADPDLYRNTFDLLEKELGHHVVQNLHIHYSIIEFTAKGEKKHHGNRIEEWGPSIDPLFQIIKDNSLTPIIINESPELEPDAVFLMEKWNKINKN